VKCPECEGTVEANPTLYLTVADDGSVEVYGIGTEDMVLSCDDNEHELDPELHREFYGKVRSSVGALENYLATGLAI